jgi:hypothetical protein
VTFKNEKYELQIEFKHDLGIETWVSDDALSPIFFRTIQYDDGFIGYQNIIPRSLKHPERKKLVPNHVIKKILSQTLGSVDDGSEDIPIE